MIYSLLLRTYMGERLQYDIDLTVPVSLAQHIGGCIDSKIGTILVSTDNVSVILPYNILSTSIIEVYEKGTNGNTNSS